LKNPSCCLGGRVEKGKPPLWQVSFSQNPKFFNVFPSRLKKISSSRVKKYPGQRQVVSLFVMMLVRSMLRSGPISIPRLDEKLLVLLRNWTYKKPYNSVPMLSGTFASLPIIQQWSMARIKKWLLYGIHNLLNQKMTFFQINDSLNYVIANLT